MAMDVIPHKWLAYPRRDSNEVAHDPGRAAPHSRPRHTGSSARSGVAPRPRILLRRLPLHTAGKKAGRWVRYSCLNFGSVAVGLMVVMDEFASLEVSHSSVACPLRVAC